MAYHRLTTAEALALIGLTASELAAAKVRAGIAPPAAPLLSPIDGAPLLSPIDGAPLLSPTGT